MEQRKDPRIRPLMHKKNETEKRFQDQAVAVEGKTPGSGGQNSGAEKIAIIARFLFR
jgi:hypothetical protein